MDRPARWAQDDPMPSAHAIRVQIHIKASPESVWALVSHHEGTPGWIPQVEQVRITEVGREQRTGVGAVRQVKFRPRMWGTVLERIVVSTAPVRFHYVLFEGMPGLLEHEGRVSVEPHEGGTRLSWEVDFVFRSMHWFRPFVPSFVKTFEGVLSGALAEAKRQLEPVQV
ncbi:MAG: SRPBCC family protein [Deltaproteobacteria bacterium]|nr:SRPBCC family protein [Deltaproteobacteria bacterium]